MCHMRREGGFTLIELLVVILVIGILIGLTLPNYRLVRERASDAALQLNMRFVSVAITTFFAENGYYADDFYEDGYGYIFEGGKKDEQLGLFPTNPFTGAQMEPDDFNTDEYDADTDVTNTAQDGPNDEWGYGAGEMRYATYTPAGALHPTLWGLIGFDDHGQSLRYFDADGNVVIVVLH